jgi:hypothetical protein
MTLKEKFENVMHNWIDKDYDRQHVASELEIDANEFAVEVLEYYHNSLFFIPLKDGEAKEILKYIKIRKGL